MVGLGNVDRGYWDTCVRELLGWGGMRDFNHKESDSEVHTKTTKIHEGTKVHPME